MCCSPWGHKESDMTELLNNNKFILVQTLKFYSLNKFQSYNAALSTIYPQPLANTILFFVFMSSTFFLFFWPCGMWDLSSSTRDQTCIPCIDWKADS